MSHVSEANQIFAAKISRVEFNPSFRFGKWCYVKNRLVPVTWSGWSLHGQCGARDLTGVVLHDLCGAIT